MNYHNLGIKTALSSHMSLYPDGSKNIPTCHTDTKPSAQVVSHWQLPVHLIKFTVVIRESQQFPFCMFGEYHANLCHVICA